MAVLTERMKNGRIFWQILFYDETDRRLAISLRGSKFKRKTAERLKDVVEKLVSCRINDEAVDNVTRAWVDAACDEIQEKLANVGLIEKPSTMTCSELWDEFLKSKTDIKSSTYDTYVATRDRFFQFFAKTTLIEKLTKSDMLRWKESMKPNIAEATIAGAITKTKAVFNWAVRQGWLPESPLTGVGRGKFVNRKNDRFVTIAEYEKLLECCPCQEWRTIISLARIGGLRCPSEVLRLKWSDIDWKGNRFHVTSSKTEHHKGKEGRTVPLFSELAAELRKLWDRDKSDRPERVIRRYVDPTQNLGTQLGRIVQMAGIGPIPRPFDNMRMSRSNEVYAEFGAFKESQWIGHSSQTRADHYLMIRDEDYRDAAGKSGGPPAETEEKPDGDGPGKTSGDNGENGHSNGKSRKFQR